MTNAAYEAILIPTEKIEDLVRYLVENALGPQEAIGLLYAAIRIIDELNGHPRSSPEQLGQELTTCLLMAEKAMQ